MKDQEQKKAPKPQPTVTEFTCTNEEPVNFSISGNDVHLVKGEKIKLPEVPYVIGLEKQGYLSREKAASVPPAATVSTSTVNKK